MTRPPQRGFSLLELMIVVAIIMIIAAISIPNLLRARQHAYEASTAGFLHTVQAEQLAYHASHGTYASSFSQLPGVAAAVAASSAESPGNPAGATSGGSSSSAASGPTSTILLNSYVFVLVRVNDDQWNIRAFPILDRYEGLYYYTDETGAVQSAKGTPPANSRVGQ